MDTLNGLLDKAYKFLQPYYSGATIIIALVLIGALVAFKKTRKLGIVLFILFMLITAIVLFGGLEHLF